MSHPHVFAQRFFSQQAIGRRGFLVAGAGSLLWALDRSAGSEIVVRKPLLGANPFTLGVASGDPEPDGFVIWTRLALKPLEGGGMPPDPIAVTWEVAEDEGFQQIVQHGESIALPQLAHSVHVEVEGLKPDRWYWYRFGVGSETSPVGRSRTMPPRDSAPAKLRFAFASCQHFEAGLFTAYQHMANEELDLVLHLGDYIYEGGTSKDKKHVREHVGPKLHSLEEYRNRHAQYKTDAFLQATHARFPWIVTWDDHEFENNYANLISDDEKVDPLEYQARRANAYQAYYEHMPLRRRSIPRGPDMLLYRRLRFGQLAEFNVLDTRQYRTDQPNGDGAKALNGDVLNPQATLLGNRQEAWLCRGLIESPCRWNVLAQQVMMARVNFAPIGEGRFAMDQWSGYDVARKRLLDFISTRKVPNPIVITGDIHANWCSDLLVDFDNKEAKPVATEFVTTSISSGGDGGGGDALRKIVLAANPFVKFQNNQRGYVRCQVTRDDWRTDYQVVEYVTRPGAPLVTRESFVVENGTPGAKKA